MGGDDQPVTRELTPHAALRKLESALDELDARGDGNSEALDRLWKYVLTGE